MVYLDNAATTKPYDSVIEEMKGMLDYGHYWGNSSSVHNVGLESKNLLESARKSIAGSIGAEPEEIYFTSGATESNNMAIKTGVSLLNGKIALSTRYEHASVKKALEFYTSKENCGLDLIDVEQNGSISIKKLKDNPFYNIGFASIMYVNNELGAINDIKSISSILRETNKDVIIHTDATQALPYAKIDVKKLGVDMLSGSAHKFHGPKGIGFLWVKQGLEVQPLIYGGEQEKGVRAGTASAVLATGMARALRDTKRNLAMNNAKMFMLTSWLKGILEDSDLVKVNKVENRVPAILSIRTDLDSQVLVGMLNSSGYAISAGSACHSGEIKPSDTLKAIGLTEEEALKTVRISISESTTQEEMIKFSKILFDILLDAKESTPEDEYDW